MSFRELIGHRAALSLLTRSVARGTLPQSLIFSGPRGVGKYRAAVATAQVLNCLNPITPGRDPATEGSLHIDSCGHCTACRRIAQGAHPALHVLAPGEMGSIKIEQVREAIDAAGYRPFEGRRRVFLIDDAEALVGPAQNALLKTLEEPQPASIFILITSMADALLPTVRSRCSQVRFGRLTAAEVASVLIRDHRYREADARAVASLADGSVGQALEARAGEYQDARRSAVELLTGVAGSTDPRARLESAKPLTTRRSGTGVAAALRTDREQVAVHLRALSSLLRDVSILATGADTQLLANVDLEARLSALAKRFDSRRAVHAFTAVDQAQDALERNVGPKIVSDWLALQL